VFLNHASLTVILTVQSGQQLGGRFPVLHQPTHNRRRGRDGQNRPLGVLKFSDALQKMTRRKAPRDGGIQTPLAETLTGLPLSRRCPSLPDETPGLLS
ncbi:unnamed protein product, partial [Arctogadus glacialis]